MISNAKISDIVNKIVLNYRPDKILLFGSYATGTANENSDLDFIIIKDTNTPKHKRGREVRRHLLGALVPMDLKIYTQDEFNIESNVDYSFLNSAIKGAKVVYERKDRANKALD
jgi:predicted nucleotidyltransferase